MPAALPHLPTFEQRGQPRRPKPNRPDGALISLPAALGGKPEEPPPAYFR